jgi:hypothetical protein
MHLSVRPRMWPALPRVLQLSRKKYNYAIFDESLTHIPYWHSSSVYQLISTAYILYGWADERQKNVRFGPFETLPSVFSSVVDFCGQRSRYIFISLLLLTFVVSLTAVYSNSSRVLGSASTHGWRTLCWSRLDPKQVRQVTSKHLRWVVGWQNLG